MGFIFYGKDSFAQGPYIFFRHLTTEDGLPSKNINTIMQDSYGFIWIGTSKGLCRYDGSEMLTIQYKNTLSVIQSRYDPSLLYVGTGQGLYSFDQNTGIFSSHPLVLNAKIPFTPSIFALYEINDSTLWIGGITGLYKYNIHTDELVPNVDSGDSLYIHAFISCIFADTKGRLWIGSTKGLFRYNKETRQFDLVPISFVKHPEVSVRDIYESKDGSFWIATYGNGLLKFNPSTYEYHVIKQNYHGFRADRISYLTSVDMDRQGYIWAGTNGTGIFSYNPRLHQFNYFLASENKITRPSENEIFCLLIDRSGVTWIGTQSQGIDIFKNSAIHFENFTSFQIKGHQEKINNTIAFHQDVFGTIWIASANKGLFQLDSLNHVIRHFTHNPEDPYSLGNNFISSITSDAHGNLWLGTFTKGIDFFDRQKNKFYHFNDIQTLSDKRANNRISAILCDHNGYIWFSTNKGNLSRMDRKGRSYRFYRLAPKGNKSVVKAFNLFEDHSQHLWAGTKIGLFLYDPVTDKFNSVPLDPNDNHPTVVSIFEDSHNTLLIATEDNIFIYHPNSKRFSAIFKKREHNFIRIRFVTKDPYDYFWIGDEKQIVSFKNKKQIIYYNEMDGIENPKVYTRAVLSSKNGYIYMGTSTGFFCFKPSADHLGLLPEIKISKFKHITESYIKDTLDIATALPEQNTVLPYDRYTLFFDFTLLDFYFPYRNTYAYKLENVQKNWRYLGNKHQLTLVNLPPGKYTLSVKGWDHKGIPCARPASITFTILPPFWQTWLFRIGSAFFLILLIALIFHLRLRSVRKRNRELQEINDNLNNEITYRKQVEKLLRESESKYRVLVESIKESIFSLNSEGKLIFLNETAAARLGGKPEDYVGKPLWEILPSRPQYPLLDEIRQVIADQKRLSIDKTVTIAGKKRFFHLSLQPILSESGVPDQALGIATEITDKIELEEQLRQSQKMEAIGQLAGGVAHDFNNLLAIIRGYTFLLLKDKKLKKSFRDIIHEIDSAGEKAQSLTGQLLAFSRKQLLEPQRIDLNHHIHNMETMLSRLIGENIQLSIEADKKLKPITADPGQIEQIILNMAVNARDAMPGGGKLTIRTRQIHVPDLKQKLPFEVKQNDYSALILKDTGIGMSKEVQQKIFDPFFTTKDKDKGTGLGLSTVFGIIKQSDGYIWVDSQPGKGTTFIMYFPSSTGEMKQLQKEQREFVKHKGSGTILLVEDEEGVRRMMSRTIQFLGYKVLEAENAELGISLVEKHQEDIILILTDVVMPGMTGVEMRDRINSKFDPIPLLFMSGYTDDEIVRQGLKSHDIHFIQKPFSADLLAQKIEEVLNQQ